MKNFFLALLAIAAVGFTSCGDDDDSTCKSCELSFLGIGVTTEYCEAGDHVIQTVSGTSDTLFNTTLSQAVEAQEAAGADCN